MKVTKSQLKELIRHAIVQEIKIPFSSSHIKQLKRAFKDMKGTLPDNNPLVQQIVTLLKKTDKKVLKQIASADIKYLSDKAKDILGEGKLSEDYKNNEWEVYLRDEKGREKIVKKAKSKRAATILYNRIIKSDDYYEVGMRAIKEQKLNEAITSYKGVFDYNPNDPHKAGRSFEEMFDGAEYGYSESWDTYGWNDQNNHDKAVEEYHKEMFKIVDGYVAANKKAQSFWKTKDKIFKKWRKTDGSKSGD